MKFGSYINAQYRETAPDPEAADTAVPGTPTPEGDATPEPEEGLWTSLSEDLEDDDIELEPEDSPEPTPEEPEPEPEPEPAPEPEPNLEKEPEPKEDPAPEPTPTPEPPKAEEPDPEKTAKQREEDAQKVQELLEQRFSLTEDESLQMMTDPGKVYPKVQARMYADMYSMIMQSIREHLPGAIQHYSQETQVQAEAQNQFFAAWPKLDKVKHGQAIAKVTKLYADLNPNATDEELIQGVGAQVMVMYGITPDEPSESEPDPTPQIPPYRPASVNGGTPPGPSSASSNIWEGMAEELIQDDDL